VLLAMRSKAATSTTENFFLRASAMRASRPGRRAFLPQTPRSSYSWTAARALASALRYFGEAAPKHTADEEESLFPRLRQIRHAEIQAVFSS